MHQYTIQVGVLSIEATANGFNVSLHPTVEKFLATRPDHRGVIDDVVRNVKTQLDVRCMGVGPQLAALEAAQSLSIEQELNVPYRTLANFFGASVL